MGDRSPKWTCIGASSMAEKRRRAKLRSPQSLGITVAGSQRPGLSRCGVMTDQLSHSEDEEWCYSDSESDETDEEVVCDDEEDGGMTLGNVVADRHAFQPAPAPAPGPQADGCSLVQASAARTRLLGAARPLPPFARPLHASNTCDLPAHLYYMQ